MKKKVNPKVMNMIDTCVVLSSEHWLNQVDLGYVHAQCREARGQPEEDAGHSAERQGKD